MSTRVKLIFALIVVAGVIGVLVNRAVTRASTFYVTVTELHHEGKDNIGKETTVNGMIVGSSIQWDVARSILKFSIQDTTDSPILPVVFYGPKPDDFQNQWPVIVTGKLQPDGIFVAEKLLIKCPSKYQTKDETVTATQS